MAAAIDLIKNSTAASYAYDLIQDKQITVKFTAPTIGLQNAGAWWTSGTNTISINTNQQGAPDSALAALIAHEATHADFDYYPVSWEDNTLQRHPELQRD